MQFVHIYEEKVQRDYFTQAVVNRTFIDTGLVINIDQIIVMWKDDECPGWIWIRCKDKSEYYITEADYKKIMGEQ